MNTPQPPRPGHVQIQVQGKEATLQDFVDLLEKMFGIRYEGHVLDSNVFQGLKYQRLEIELPKR